MEREGKTFRQWLSAQRRRDDRVGDVARDVGNDHCAKGLRGAESLRGHLEVEHGVGGLVLAAFDAAVDEWEAA